jgi:hypothetical protein
MRIAVKLNASLRRFLPKDSDGNVARLTLPKGATVGDAVRALGIPPAHAKIAVSGSEQLDMSSSLIDGQEVSLFPPLAGGS